MPKLNPDRRHRVSFTHNGKAISIEVEARMLLCDALRHVIGATGTHVGCEHGVCGACTVIVDGMPARSCLMLAVQAEGCDIRTVEGLSPCPDRLSVLQAAFRRHHALQCGFCTAGILMSLTAYLAASPEPSEEELKHVIGGHLCRCTGYAPIIKAALEAAATLRQKNVEEKVHA
jgi:2-furoyl-CoA dehydrogenase 2Fe-2S iron sulfur subunit